MRIALALFLVLSVALPILAEEPVAVVNGEQISREELQQVTNWSAIVLTIYQQFPRFARTLLTTEEGKALHQRFEEDMLDRLILHTLQLQEARRRELSPDERRVQAEVDKIVADVARRNQLTPEQLGEVLARQGRSLDAFREEIAAWAREDLLLEALHGDVVGQVTVDEADIADYYETNEDAFYDAEGKLTPLQEVRDDIEARLLESKRNEIWQTWLEQLREEAEITVNL